MRRKSVKTLISYYVGIPSMIKLLDQERRGLEDEYNGLHGTSMDGMPHSSTPGKPTEELAAKMEAKNTYGRIQEITVKTQVLRADAAIIRDGVDELNGKYKKLVFMRYRDKYSWGKISIELGVPESTVRARNDRALDRLGETLEDAPMVEELLGRASRARV